MVVELHVNDLPGSLSFWRDVLVFRRLLKGRKNDLPIWSIPKDINHALPAAWSL